VSSVVRLTVLSWLYSMVILMVLLGVLFFRTDLTCYIQWPCRSLAQSLSGMTEIRNGNDLSMIFLTCRQEYVLAYVRCTADTD
jgi:hypothetical protein